MDETPQIIQLVVPELLGAAPLTAQQWRAERASNTLECSNQISVPLPPLVYWNISTDEVPAAELVGTQLHAIVDLHAESSLAMVRLPDESELQQSPGIVVKWAATLRVGLADKLGHILRMQPLAEIRFANAQLCGQVALRGSYEDAAACVTLQWRRALLQFDRVLAVMAPEYLRVQ